jgi:Flp pilus assembly protein TadD
MSSGTIVFAIALGVRGLHIWLLRDSLLFSVLMGDARAYDEWAARLAAGDWMGSEVFYQAPLYPYFVGVIYSLGGRDLMLVRIVQALVGASAAMLVQSAAARLFSPRAGLSAGLLMALYPPAIFVSGILQKASLDVLLVSTAIYAIARMHGVRDHRRWWFALGVTLALLSLTRENALALIGVAVLFARRRTAFAYLLGVAIILTPVAIRNHLVGGGFYLTTSQFGPNLFIGNNPRADGTYQALRAGRGDAAFERDDATELAESATGRRLSPAEVSGYWRAQAIDYITSSPVAWLRLMARKGLLLLSATEMPDTEAQESHAEHSFVLRMLQPVGHFGVMLPLAMLGLMATWPKRQSLVMLTGRSESSRRMSISPISPNSLWTLYALAVAYALSVLVFFVVARYRYPLVPFVLLFAGAGLAGLPSFVRHATRRQQLVTLALMAVIAAVAFRPVLASDVMRAMTATNVGVALQAQNRLDAAAAQYQHAIAIRPDYAPAYNNLGVVLQTRGQVDEAIATYQQALRYFPDDPGTHMNLGEALRRRGRLAEAASHYRRRVELDPSNPAARYDLGNVLLEARDLVGAEREFRRLTQLAPDAPQAHSRLGVALAAQDRFDEAIMQFKKALSLRPDFAEAQRYLQLAEDASRQ